VHWQQVGKVAGAGNSSQFNNYSYTDKQPLDGTSYYRLQQTNTDGTYTYSLVAVVRRKNESISLQVYPNPVNNEVIIKGNKDDLKKLRVFDLAGREVTHQLRVTSNGETTKVVSMAAVSDGMYIFRINDQSYKVLKK